MTRQDQLTQPTWTGAGRVVPSAEVARRLLRYEIQQMCNEAGATHKQVGHRLGVSRASFTQIVAGTNLPSQPAVEIIAQYLGKEQRTPFLLHLLRAARVATHPRRDDDRDLALGLEAFARSITIVDLSDVPPLLRTMSYARARFTNSIESRPNLDVDQELQLLARRQQALAAENGPPSLVWITAEPTFRRKVVDESAAADQLRHLLGAAASEHIDVHIIPSHVPVGHTDSFELFQTDEGRLVAHQRTLRTSYYYDTADAIADYAQRIDHLRAHALDAARSRQLIADIYGSPARG